MSENGGALGLHLPNPNADKANAQRGNSLEVLLATKNKRILEELTKFRVRPRCLAPRLPLAPCVNVKHISGLRCRSYMESSKHPWKRLKLSWL